MVGYFSPWLHCSDRDPAGCRVQVFGFLDVNVGKSSMCRKKETDAEIWASHWPKTQRSMAITPMIARIQDVFKGWFH